MSQRGKSGKRQNRNDDNATSAKRRKGRPKASAAVEDEDEGWTAREVKGGSIYNQRAPEAPAELFRKDLISAMKLPDNEPLVTEDFYAICDQWKPEWERGVQVPVNPDSLPEPVVTVTHTRPQVREFKLPKLKYLRITSDERMQGDNVHLSSVAARWEASCHYDLDDVDMEWLKALNGERALMGYPPVSEEQLERVMEELERRCWDRIQSMLKAEEGLGIEYDENVICDVCRSPDSEEGNEMVFCDSCNICVHQACYGITAIPSGSWLCRTCALSKRPECVLCPNKGGAMKCTKLGHEWAHVSCALWIPEVSIGCVERMEPITKIANIPASRWGLICVLCRERVGACIQCSVKTCKTAYHVTCAFKNGLEMRAIIEDEMADDGVKLRSYCQKHSVKKEPMGHGSGDDEMKKKKRKDMTSEERNQARVAKLHEIEAEFFKHVSISEVAGSAALLEVDQATIESVYNYWKLKRRVGNNAPLLPFRTDDSDTLHRLRGQQDVEKMRLFVQLRQDLERVRNLCYMVSRREKLSRSFFRTREQTFHKQAALLSSNAQLTPQEVSAVLQANHAPNIYDQLYSHSRAPDNTDEFDKILVRIQGGYNGLSKIDTNPYKKNYINGTTRRRSLFGSSSESGGDQRVRDSSSEDGRFVQKPLRRLQREVGRSLSHSDSDDLLPLPNQVNRISKHIYSDTDSTDEDEKSRLRNKPPIKTVTDRRKPARKTDSKADKENIKSSKTKREPVVPERNSARRQVDQLKTTKRKREGTDISSEEPEIDTKPVKTITKADKSKPAPKPKDSALGDKDNLLSYVPQRKAAKKASETIKSGLKQQDEVKVPEPKKVVEEERCTRATSSSSTSSSTSCSSSSNSSTSSSDSEQETPKPPPKSIFDPEPISRKQDRPFLDKAPQSDELGDQKFKKAPDKKLKTSDGRPENEFQPPTLTREEPRAASSSDRVRGARARSRDLIEDSSPTRPSRARKSASTLSPERSQATQSEPSTSAFGKTEEADKLRRKSTRNAEVAKEPPPVSPVKERKEELPVKRGPGRPRRTSPRTDSPEPNAKTSTSTIPLETRASRPMPRSAKKALGLLDGVSPEKTASAVEPVELDNSQKSEPIHDKRSDVAEKNFDKDKFRRNTTPSPPIEAPAAPETSAPTPPPLLDVANKPIEASRTSPTLDLVLDSEAPKTGQRSLFSPHANRDNLNDILNFEDDISAVDETVREERPLGLFNFNNDLLFREDSKEDTKRETYNLVEKLRMEYAKKCGNQEAMSPRDRKDLADMKDDKSDANANGLCINEGTTDSQGPPPTPGYLLDSHPAVQHLQHPDKFTPTSQDSVISVTSAPKSVDSPASLTYQQQYTPQTPLSQCPNTPSSQPAPHTPSSQNYPMQAAPLTPSSCHNTPQTPLSSHNYQPPAGLTPQGFNNPPGPLMANYGPATPQQGFPSTAATAVVVNGVAAFPPGAPMYPTGPPSFENMYGTCASAIRETAKLLGQPMDKVEGGSGSDERWLPPNSNASSSVYPSPSEGYPRWQDSQVISRRSSSASVTSESESTKPEAELTKQDPKPLANCLHGPPSNPDPSHKLDVHKIVEAMKEAADMYLPYVPDGAPFHPYSEASPFVLPYPYGPQMYHPMKNVEDARAMSFPPPPQQPLPIPTPMISPSLEPEPRSNKKPPARPTRVASRAISQGKSPDKSPKGKETVSRRGRGPSSSSRGRGRGRGRGRHTPVYDDIAIRTKLVGTVYDIDFEEDGFDDSLENLKAMRDRRRSTDVHDKKHESSPRTPLPMQTQMTFPPVSAPQVFPDVAPPLPGPVDMRTYSSFEPPTNSTEYQTNLLNAFSNAAEAPHVNDFDEEMEKELQNALTASPTPQPVQPTPTSTPPIRPNAAETPDSVTKVSLSDSRNQLKVKIKGPFRDENYSATALPQPTIPPPIQPTPPVQAALTGTLRRMRKKELLRQYWTQDMNMDEVAAPAAPQAPPPSRTAITIPKAVASMTSIPTREDYKALIDANSDKKGKGHGGDELTDEEEPVIPERRPSLGSRMKTPKPPPAIPQTPKLKIKIGAAPPPEIEKKNLRVRPPKKRHTPAVVMPTVEELRRESMKYRRKVMADFDDDGGRVKPKSKKKKKRKCRDEAPLQPPPKLIIKFGGKDKFTVNPTPRTMHDTDGRTDAPPPEIEVDPLAIGPSDVPLLPPPPPQSVVPVTELTPVDSVRTSKTSPIRLKLARSEQGAYVMATGPDTSTTDCPPVTVR